MSKSNWMGKRQAREWHNEHVSKIVIGEPYEVPTPDQRKAQYWADKEARKR